VRAQLGDQVADLGGPPLRYEEQHAVELHGGGAVEVVGAL
jgi:hypothetical protein